MTKLIMDTDIGTDVDDAMTLVQLAGSGLADAMAITTVYGDTQLRARIASRYCRLAGVSVPIHFGESMPLSGKKVWLSGMEGSLHAGLEQEPAGSPGAVEFLLEQTAKAPGEVVVLAIGPLTNLASACLQDADFARRVKHLFVMGGRFDGGEPEHNFVSDAVAAEIVFNAGFSATVVGLEATRRIQLPKPLIDRIAGAGPAGHALSRDIYQWWEFWQETWSVPHDPISALTFLSPELFSFSEPGRIRITSHGLHAGRSEFEPGPGSHRIVLDFDPSSVGERIVSAIEAAALVQPPAA